MFRSPNWVLKKLFYYVHIVAVASRYKIQFKGFSELKLNPNFGMLVIQNHTTHIDPMFTVVPHLKKSEAFHIWVSDFVFKISYIKLFSQWLEGVRFLKVPCESKSGTHDSPEKAALYKKELNHLIQRSADCLYKKKNVVIHPSGHSKKEPREIVGHTTGVHQVLKRCPEANIVLVRHRGLWGSRFSQAAKRDPKWKGENQKWKSLLTRVCLMFLLNLFFFIPKRKVEVEYVLAPPDFPREGPPEAINAYLETFFNAKWGEAGEPLSIVPDFFWEANKAAPETQAVKQHRT